MDEKSAPDAFSNLSLPALRVWAKSGEVFGHPLIAHLLDVAAVAETLYGYESIECQRFVAKMFGISAEHIPRWLATLVGLHDFGKTIPGFQEKWPEGRREDENAGLVFTEQSVRVTDHAAATAALLTPYLYWAGVKSYAWIGQVLQAISAHHGYNFLPSYIQQSKPTREKPEWESVRAEIFNTFWGLLAPYGSPSRNDLNLPAVQWLAGITSVADWIGSNTDWFPIGQRGFDDLAQYYEDARQRAKIALEEIGWKKFSPLLNGSVDVNTLIERMVQKKDIQARPLQQVADNLLVDSRGASLVVVEAPMGEGKTELAFLAHLRLQAKNGHRGFYIALPTQATGNALFSRALTFLGAFANDQQLDMQLVHGGSSMNDEVIRLRGIYGSQGESVTSSEWFSQRRRPLLSPYGVGTVDQALFAALNVKHHFVRLWGLANKVVIFDEIHAYDSYTLGLVETLLRWLKALGCSVVLMSATLPSARRAQLLRAWSVDNNQIPELPYPRVYIADEVGVRGEHFSSRPQATIKLAACYEGLDAIAELVEQKLLDGGCGAVIVNTIDRAQELYQSIKKTFPGDVELVLFHARYPADQRGEIEKKVLSNFGAEGMRPSCALLIATQVAEQSLDIDFDFMVTDLAPMDLILQRAGRLHRHTRERPIAHKIPILTVAGLAPDALPDLTNTAWKFVYASWVLGRTWALLSRESQISLPADIDRFVQAVYDEQYPLPEDVALIERGKIEGEFLCEYEGNRIKEIQFARNVAIDPRHEPHLAYADKQRGYEQGEEGIGLPNTTRLDADSLRVVPVYQTEGGWAVTPNGDLFDPASDVTSEQARRLRARQMSISRKAAMTFWRAQPECHAFSSHPWLKSFTPLVLAADGVSTIGPALKLDEELGLVYLKKSADADKE